MIGKYVVGNVNHVTNPILLVGRVPSIDLVASWTLYTGGFFTSTIDRLIGIQNYCLSVR